MDYSYKIIGRGDIPLLCVHGFPFDNSMWDLVAEEISSDFRIIAPDLRGMGKTPPGEGNCVTMAELAQDLAILLDALDVEKCVYCGLSMGGYVGWEFCERFFDRLLGLILCDSNAGCDTPEAAANREVTARRVETEGPAFLADAMMGNILAPETMENRLEIVAWYRRMIETNNAQGVAAIARGLGKRRDFREKVAQITLPTLILSGEADILSPPAAMKTLAARMPHAEYVPIAHAGHLPPLENATETASAIRDFCRREITVHS